MEVWISRDSQKAGGYVLAWVKEPTLNGVLWFCQESRYSFTIWSWTPRDFENKFSFQPDFGTCRKMRMRIEQQPEATQ